MLATTHLIFEPGESYHAAYDKGSNGYKILSLRRVQLPHTSIVSVDIRIDPDLGAFRVAVAARNVSRMHAPPLLLVERLSFGHRVWIIVGPFTHRSNTVPSSVAPVVADEKEMTS